MVTIELARGTCDQVCAFGFPVRPWEGRLSVEMDTTVDGRPRARIALGTPADEAAAMPREDVSLSLLGDVEKLRMFLADLQDALAVATEG